MIDLREIDKQRIGQLAKANLKSGTELWAYGSRIKGNSFEASDLDLVIKSCEQSPLSIDELVEFKQALQDSNIPIVIQVLDWERIPPAFQQNILACYEVLVTC
jgi:predicted nucleotidyltransferase